MCKYAYISACARVKEIPARRRRDSYLYDTKHVYKLNVPTICHLNKPLPLSVTQISIVEKSDGNPYVKLLLTDGTIITI